MSETKVDEKYLANLELLERQATKGPWKQRYTANNAGTPLADFFIPGHNGNAAVEMLSDDAVFIVAAREAVPLLTERVRELGRACSDERDTRHALNRELTAARARIPELERENSELRRKSGD